MRKYGRIIKNWKWPGNLFLDQLYVVKSKIQQLEKGGKEMKLALSSCERQLYVMKPKVQLLEKGKKEMKTALISCERRIKVVENRKYMFFFQNIIGKSNKIVFMI